MRPTMEISLNRIPVPASPIWYEATWSPSMSVLQKKKEKKKKEVTLISGSESNSTRFIFFQKVRGQLPPILDGLGF